MADSEICRSSAACERPATHGTFGAYLCEDHYAEIDLIRRKWFTVDGAPLRKERDPNDAPLSLSGIADAMVEIVREAHPEPVNRTEMRRTLGLPYATAIQAATIASARKQLVSTPTGHVLSETA